jgi:hypothetical protein
MLRSPGGFGGGSGSGRAGGGSSLSRITFKLRMRGDSRKRRKRQSADQGADQRIQKWPLAGKRSSLSNFLEIEVAIKRRLGSGESVKRVAIRLERQFGLPSSDRAAPISRRCAVADNVPVDGLGAADRIADPPPAGLYKTACNRERVVVQQDQRPYRKDVSILGRREAAECRVVADGIRGRGRQQRQNLAGRQVFELLA